MHRRKFLLTYMKYMGLIACHTVQSAGGSTASGKVKRTWKITTVVPPFFQSLKGFNSIFFDVKGPVAVDTLPDKSTLTASYYVNTVMPKVVRLVCEARLTIRTWQALLLQTTPVLTRPRSLWPTYRSRASQLSPIPPTVLTSPHTTFNCSINWRRNSQVPNFWGCRTSKKPWIQSSRPSLKGTSVRPFKICSGGWNCAWSTEGCRSKKCEGMNTTRPLVSVWHTMWQDFCAALRSSACCARQW